MTTTMRRTTTARRRPPVALALLAAATLTTTSAALGQALDRSFGERIAAVPEGDVRLSFLARDGVCGDGRGSVSIGARPPRGWDTDCDPGPVRVRLTVSAGRVVGLRTLVGGRWGTAGEGVTDLGEVPARAAADYLLALAGRAEGRVGADAISAASLADGVELWPVLLRLARADSIPRATRRAAVTQLGYAAGEAAVAGLDEIVRDEDEDASVRESALYALSQRPPDEGTPLLVRIARSGKSASLRRKAIYYLSQSDDPRALALFEELLTKR